MPEPSWGNDRNGGIGAGLGGVAAVIAECYEVHSAQHGADHGYANLHDLAFTRLQGVEGVDTGGIRPRAAPVTSRPFFSKKPRSSAIGRPI